MFQKRGFLYQKRGFLFQKRGFMFQKRGFMFQKRGFMFQKRGIVYHKRGNVHLKWWIVQYCEACSDVWVTSRKAIATHWKVILHSWSINRRHVYTKQTVQSERDLSIAGKFYQSLTIIATHWKESFPPALPAPVTGGEFSMEESWFPILKNPDFLWRNPDFPFEKWWFHF